MTQLQTFVELANAQPIWMRSLLVVTAVGVAAVAFGVLMALVMTLLEAAGEVWRGTFVSWYLDRHARRDRKRTADTLAEMNRLEHMEDYKRRRLNSIVSAGERR